MSVPLNRSVARPLGRRVTRIAGQIAFWLVVCALAVQTSTLRANEPVDRDALIARVWQITRLELLSQTMAANILTGVSQHPDLNQLPAHQRSRILLLYRQHTKAERFSRRLYAHLAQASRDNLHALITLTESTVARRALAQELAFSPVPLAQMQSWRDANQSDQQHQTRLDLTERLDHALGVTDIAVAVAGASLYGTSIALRQVQADDHVEPNIDAAIRDFGERIRPVQHEQIQLTYFYLYRRLTIADLRNYVELLESEPVRSIQRRLIQILGSEMVAIQGDVVRGIIAQANDKADKADKEI